jgi:hypothetical protein
LLAEIGRQQAHHLIQRCGCSTGRLRLQWTGSIRISVRRPKRRPTYPPLPRHLPDRNFGYTADLRVAIARGGATDDGEQAESRQQLSIRSRNPADVIKPASSVIDSDLPGNPAIGERFKPHSTRCFGGIHGMDIDLRVRRKVALDQRSMPLDHGRLGWITGIQRRQMQRRRHCAEALQTLNDTAGVIAATDRQQRD